MRPLLSFVCIAFFALIAMPAQAQTPTPPVPQWEIDRIQATNAANINALPSDPTRPGGQAIPSVDLTQLFGYAKWLFSASTAQELFGRTLAPLAINVFIVLVLAISYSAIWLLINIIVLIIKVVMWIVRLIIQMIELIPFF